MPAGRSLASRMLQQKRRLQMSVGMTEVLGRYLDLTAEQMKVTASNMANIDTPGYKTQGFDFEQALGSAMQGSPVISDVDGLIARPDGNTVSLDRESLNLAKSQLQFRTGVSLMKSEFSRVMSAIHAESK
jgi:flagellar basal-body rod protein FlgB